MPGGLPRLCWRLALCCPMLLATAHAVHAAVQACGCSSFHLDLVSEDQLVWCSVLRRGSSEWLYGLWAPLLGGMTGGAVAGGLATVLSDLIS